MTTEVKKTWEIKFSKYLGWEKFGLRFVGARPYRFGKWLKAEELPKEVFNYCHLKNNGKRWIVDAKVKDTYFVRKISVKQNKPALIDIDRVLLENTLKELNEGRNLACWQLCSFGWKDADLDFEGCTGIDHIVGVEGKSVVVEIGGHKTFCNPTHECEFDLSEDDERMYGDIAESVICDINSSSGEWTGDDWSFEYRNDIKVPIIKTNGKIDYNKLAKRIINAAKKDLEPIQEDWKQGDKAIEEIYLEMRKKYEHN